MHPRSELHHFRKANAREFELVYRRKIFWCKFANRKRDWHWIYWKDAGTRTTANIRDLKDFASDWKTNFEMFSSSPRSYLAFEWEKFFHNLENWEDGRNVQNNSAQPSKFYHNPKASITCKFVGNFEFKNRSGAFQTALITYKISDQMWIVIRIQFRPKLWHRTLFAGFFARFTGNAKRYQSRHKNVQEKLLRFYISKSTTFQNSFRFLQIHSSFSAFREGKQYFMSPAFCYGKIVYLL